jgi:hypothetical protein
MRTMRPIGTRSHDPEIGMSYFDRMKHRLRTKDDVKSGDLPSRLPEQKSRPKRRSVQAVTEGGPFDSLRETKERGKNYYVG